MLWRNKRRQHIEEIGKRMKVQKKIVMIDTVVSKVVVAAAEARLRLRQESGSGCGSEQH